MMPRTLEPEVMDTPEEADGYDSMDHSGPNESFVARLVELGASGAMLDIGTGPGHLPLMVCERIANATVVGIDLSHHMLRHAERHRLGSRHAQRISYRIDDAKRIDFADASFDAVYSNTILHHVADPLSYLREAWRVLKPGGAFLIRDLFRPATPARALELVAAYAAGANAYQQELFRASLHAALTPAELRELARAAGLEGAELVIDTDRHMSLQRAASRSAPSRR